VPTRRRLADSLRAAGAVLGGIVHHVAHPRLRRRRERLAPRRRPFLPGVATARTDEAVLAGRRCRGARRQSLGHFANSFHTTNAQELVIADLTASVVCTTCCGRVSRRRLRALAGQVTVGAEMQLRPNALCRVVAKRADNVR